MTLRFSRTESETFIVYIKDNKSKEAVTKLHHKIKKLNLANDESLKNGLFELVKSPSIQVKAGRKSIIFIIL